MLLTKYELVPDPLSGAVSAVGSQLVVICWRGRCGHSSSPGNTVHQTRGLKQYIDKQIFLIIIITTFSSSLTV